MENNELWLEPVKPKLAERCCICRKVMRDKSTYDVKSRDIEFYNRICEECRLKFYVGWEIRECKQK